MSQTWTTHSAEETEKLGETLANVLPNGGVLALFGGMGAGKTAFVRGFARGCGITSPVSSPTFALVHDYGGKPPLVHFDMYRIGGWEDLYTTGYYDYLDMGALLVVEWSENIEAALPPDAVRLQFTVVDEYTRRIERIENA